MSVDLTQYKVGVISSIEECGTCKGGNKVLRALKVQIAEGDDDDCFVTVVTSANNVREKSRLVLMRTQKA
jgi:tRNA-binding EMAP/Myf-like protein